MSQEQDTAMYDQPDEETRYWYVSLNDEDEETNPVLKGWWGIVDSDVDRIIAFFDNEHDAITYVDACETGAI